MEQDVEKYEAVLVTFQGKEYDVANMPKSELRQLYSDVQDVLSEAEKAYKRVDEEVGHRKFFGREGLDG